MSNLIFNRPLGEVLNEGTTAIENYLKPRTAEEVVAYAIQLEQIIDIATEEIRSLREKLDRQAVAG